VLQLLLFNNSTPGGTVNLNVSKARIKQRIIPSTPPSPIPSLIQTSSISSYRLLVRLFVTAGPQSSILQEQIDRVDRGFLMTCDEAVLLIGKLVPINMPS
jgi:hypothetical protein